MDYDIDKEYELACNLEKIIVPKLKAISNSGDGALIHKANTFICIISNLEWHIKKDFVISRVITYKEYLKSAEEWLLSLVGEK